MPYLKKPNRRNYLPPRPERKPTGDQSFLNTGAWRSKTRLYRQRNPLCEVSAAIGRDEAADCTDHIIAREFGGSLFDERNLMAMSNHYHNRKSGMETHGAFLRTVWTPSGLIPEDRSQIINILTKDRSL